MAVQIIDHPVLQVFSLIGQIDNDVRDAIAESLPEGLSVAQYEVLRHLEMYGDGLSPAELVQRLQGAKSAMTANLQRLEANGLVRIEPCSDDGRRKRVRITREGREVFARAMLRIRPKMEHLREAFTIEEFRAALPFLKALSAWFEERDWAETTPESARA